MLYFDSCIIIVFISMSETVSLLNSQHMEDNCVEYHSQGVVTLHMRRPSVDPDHLDSSACLVEDAGLGKDENADACAEYHSVRHADFHTIDWLREIARDRLRHRDINRQRTGTISNRIRSLCEALSGWLIVLIIGVLVGCIAGAIDIAVPWFSDLKFGFCDGSFWLNKEQCCWGIAVEVDDLDCQQWVTWPQFLGVPNSSGAGSYIMSYIMFVVIATSFAVLSAVLVWIYGPYASASGIPEIKTILSGFVIHGFFGKMTLLAKSTGVILSVASNLCVGKEGPMVHIACCIGNFMSYFFPKYSHNEARKREVLSASAAAGVSVAFGAPVGGVLFSLEEASYYFPMETLWRSFFCAMVAAFVLRSINPFGDSHLVLFSVNYTRPWYMIELIPFIFLGVLGGLFGALFIKFNTAWCRRRKTTSLGQHAFKEVLIIVIVTALLAYPNEYTRKSMSELIKQLMSSCSPGQASELCDYSNRTLISALHGTSSGYISSGLRTAIWKLSLALGFKIIMTIFTFGIKVPAGIFVPSMCIGAIMGRLVGLAMEQIAYANKESFLFVTMCRFDQQCVEPGLYAMIGAAAVMGGVTRMTVSLVVIMFELTGGLQYIVPLMAAILTSKWVADSIISVGIYDAHIILNGYPYLDNKEECTVTSLAADFMMPQSGSPPLAVLPQRGMTVTQIKECMQKSSAKGFPIVESEESRYVVGFIERRELRLALATALRRRIARYDSPVHFTLVDSVQTDEEPQRLTLNRIVNMAPIAITDQTPMEIVFEMFRKLGLRQTLVIRHGKLLGIITKKDILRHMAFYEKRKGLQMLGTYY